jgi:hypothetical protein
MTADRITWRDVERAAVNLGEVARLAGIDIPAHWRLAVSPGSVTNGHAGSLYWTTDTTPPVHQHRVVIEAPGGTRLARSAADSYVMATQRTAALLWHRTASGIQHAAEVKP